MNRGKQKERNNLISPGFTPPSFFYNIKKDGEVKPGEINEERKRHDKAPPVPLGDAARDVIVQLADPTAQVPDHVHWTCAHVISIVIDHGLVKIQSH